LASFGETTPGSLGKQEGGGRGRTSDHRNRSAEHGQTLTCLIRERTGVPTPFVVWEGTYPVPDGTDLLVNATSQGLYPDTAARVPIDTATLRPGLVVSDVIPNPPLTNLIREARNRGCVALDGLGMLVNQGVIGIRLWTGRNLRPEVAPGLEGSFDA
jgi:shikimate dehydrogenase